MNFFGFGKKKAEEPSKYTATISASEREMYTLNTSKQPLVELAKAPELSTCLTTLS